MKKETLKTITLVLLVLSSIILTINNWFSEKLWPDGYNFFSNLANYFSDEEAPKSYYLSKENVSNPTKLIVNNNEYRGMYTHTSTHYNDMVEPVKKILKQGLKSESYDKGTEEAWKNALKTKSIYIAYPVAYGTKTFSALMDTPIKAVENGSIQEFVIAAGDAITGKPHLLIKNAASDSFVDVTLTADSTEIDEIIERYAVSSIGELPYSFELNFDKSGDAIEQKVIIEPQVVLSINPMTASTVTATNYFENISGNKELYSEFLHSFGFNTSNMKKYVNVDNSIVFAENYGSIKMYPDGLMEYKSLDDTMGIEIGKSTEFYDTFIDCIEFVNNIWDTACHKLNMNINLSSVKTTGSDNSFVLTIDYFADGMEIVSALPANESHDKISHAIEVEVKNSRVISYRQIVKGYETNNDEVQCSSVIEALDTLMANESIKSDTITDLYLAYYPYKKTIYAPCWVAKTDKNEIRIIKNQ
ncbi:MAG: hypothetical protein J6D26_08975 [Clostridia bacterium]|nr:hypothetical protein [Clostridia bacterium]